MADRPDSASGAVSSASEPASARPDEGAGFYDRRDAGRRLAAKVRRLTVHDPVVIGIVRGGVPVAAEVADALGAPLDVSVVCKVRLRRMPTYAIGALAEGNITVTAGRAVRRRVNVGSIELGDSIATARAQLDRSLRSYRREHAPLPVRNRTVVLVDDGLATGLSAEAAARSVRQRGATETILAVAVGAMSAALRLRSTLFTEVLCEQKPFGPLAIESWYEDFAPVSERQIAGLVARRERAFRQRRAARGRRTRLQSRV